MFYVYVNKNSFVYKKQQSEVALGGKNIHEVEKSEYAKIHLGSRLVDGEWIPPKESASSQLTDIDSINQRLEKQQADIDYLAVMTGVDLDV